MFEIERKNSLKTGKRVPRSCQVNIGRLELIIEERAVISLGETKSKILDGFAVGISTKTIKRDLEMVGITRVLEKVNEISKKNLRSISQEIFYIIIPMIQ